MINLRQSDNVEQISSFKKYTERRTKILSSILEKIGYKAPEKAERLKEAYEYEDELIVIKNKYEELSGESLSWAEFDLLGSVLVNIMNIQGAPYEQTTSLYNLLNVKVDKLLTYILKNELTLLCVRKSYIDDQIKKHTTSTGY